MPLPRLVTTFVWHSLQPLLPARIVVGIAAGSGAGFSNFRPHRNKCLRRLWVWVVGRAANAVQVQIHAKIACPITAQFPTRRVVHASPPAFWQACAVLSCFLGQPNYVSILDPLLDLPQQYFCLTCRKSARIGTSVRSAFHPPHSRCTNASAAHPATTMTAAATGTKLIQQSGEQRTVGYFCETAASAWSTAA